MYPRVLRYKFFLKSAVLVVTYFLNKILMSSFLIFFGSLCCSNLFKINIFFLFDFILFIYIKTDRLTHTDNRESILLTFLLALFWCLSSYILGKYSYFKNKAYLINKILNLIKSNLFAIIFIYLIDKVIIIYFPSLPPFTRDKIIILGLISFLLQFFKLYIYKLINKKHFSGF